MTSSFAEDLDKSTLTPWEYVLRTATEKILNVYKTLAETDDGSDDKVLLIAADTIVLCGHRILEKPTSASDQLEMLKLLRSASRDSPSTTHASSTLKSPSAAPSGASGVLGKSTHGGGGAGHQVITALVCLLPDDETPIAPGYILRSTVTSTTVHFDPLLSDDVLLSYVPTGEGMGLAGGYGIQGQAQAFVTRIEGAYDGVVGLPLNALYRLIEETLAYDIYQDQDNVNL